MANVILHVFANDDLNGSVIETFTDEDDFFEGCELRPALDELGGGSFTLSKRAGLDLADPQSALKEENFVRVLIPAVSSTIYQWGFFLTNRSKVVVSPGEHGGENYVMGGPGPKWYLARHALWPERFGGTGYEIDRENGVFRWQESESAGGVLHRLIVEAHANTVVDGIPDLTKDFNASLDSDGNAWADNIATPGQFELPIGQSYLDNLWELENTGDIETIVRLGTVATPVLELQARPSYGRDLTAASTTDFSAGVVHFAEAVNILTELVSVGNAFRKKTHVIIRGKDGVYETRTKPSYTPGAYASIGYIERDRSSDPDVLDRYGLRWLQKQDGNENEIELEIRPGFTPTSGHYFPSTPNASGHFWIGDEISLTSGTETSFSNLDYRNETQRVMAIRMVLDEASVDDTAETKALSWHIVPELNVERGSLSTPAGGGGGATGGVGCTCLKMCGVGGLEFEVVWDSHLNELSFGYIDPADGTTEVELWHNDGTGVLDSVPIPPNVLVWYLRDHDCDDLHLSTDSHHFLLDRHTDDRLLFRWIDSGASCERPPGTGSFGLTTDDNVAIAFSVTQGGLPDLVGNDGTAARCDHSHSVFRDVPPTADDDVEAGYPIGTLWTIPGGATYILLDNTAGAAVWQAIGPSSTGQDTTDTFDLLTGHHFIIAVHRGDINPRDGYPENTLEAVRQAALKGCKVIEFDVQRDSEGTWQVMHDTTVDRTTDGTGAVSSKTTAQMAALNIDGGLGYDAGRHSTTLNVPTAQQVVDALKPYDVIYLWDLKETSDAAHTALAEFIVENDIAQRSRIGSGVSTDAPAQAVKAVDERIVTSSLVTDPQNYPALDMHGEVIDDITSLAEVTAVAPKYYETWFPSEHYGEDEEEGIRDAFAYGVRWIMVADYDLAMPIWADLMGVNPLGVTTITSPAEGDMLRYDGEAWVNTPGRWEPVTDGASNFVFSSGDIAMAWKDT